MNQENIAIIGAGPSGMAMAIQLKRYGLEPFVFEKDAPGGLLKNANLVENYPGFPGGVRGPELVELMVNQLEEARVTVLPEEVTDLDFRGDAFVLRTRKKRYRFQRVAVASGTKPVKVSLAEYGIQETQLISYEVYPLLKQKWKRIVVVGAGDAAFDYALNLAWQNDVVLLNRGSLLTCLPLLFERARNHPNITYYQNTAISRIDLDESGSQAILHCTSPAGMRKINVDYLIFAIGRQPCMDYISQNMQDCQDELVAQGRLYLIGDVKNDIFRQTTIAVGDGVLAAMKLYRACTEGKPGKKPSL